MKLLRQSNLAKNYDKLKFLNKPININKSISSPAPPYFSCLIIFYSILLFDLSGIKTGLQNGKELFLSVKKPFLKLR